MAETSAPVERLYDFLTGEGEQRACAAIPDRACTDVPRNFLLNVASGACTKLGEQVASPGLVLPWLLAALAAPTALVGFLVPIRQAGALLPQLAVAGRIRRTRRRKWVWTGAGAVQAIALLLMGTAALALPPLGAGLAILALLAVFSVASGAGSVAFQDVVGKTIPKGRRGRLLAYRAMVGGVLTLGAAVLLKLFLTGESGIGLYVVLLVAAATLWTLAAALFTAIEELPGATEGGRSMIGELRQGLGLLREEPGYRQFLVARGLLVAVEAATPYFALHARDLTGESLGTLGIYIFALGLANIVSSPLWGAFADTSSRRVMVLAGLTGAAAGLAALGLELAPPAWRNQYAYAPVFILVGIAEAGVRLGRKTYLVDGAPAAERALYVAFSNSAVGLVMLAAGGLGLLAGLVGVRVVLALLVALTLTAAAAAWAMPEAERMAAGRS